jgi:hypothetical protein
MFENRTLTASAGGFTDSFAGVGRHVYAITSSNTTFSANITRKSGPTAARDWTVLASNTGIGVAGNANITDVTFTQTGGTACTPSVAPGILPVSLATLAPGATATGKLVVNFTGCEMRSRFTVALSIAANSGGTTGTVTLANQRY